MNPTLLQIFYLEKISCQQATVFKVNSRLERVIKMSYSTVIQGTVSGTYHGLHRK